MNREELHDPLVGCASRWASPWKAPPRVCMTPWTPGRAQRGAGAVKSYMFTMKDSVNFDAGDKVIMSIAGHV